MNNYEKRIGLKTIYLTFIRRFVEMIIVFVPIALTALLVTKVFMKPSYSSSVTFTKSTTFRISHYEILIRTIKSDAAYDKVSSVVNLTKSQYYEGLSCPTSYSDNSKSEAVFSFKSNDKSIPTIVINTVAEYAKAFVNENEPFDKEIDFLPATNYSINDSSTKYLLIAIAADVIFSLGVPFIFEIVGDQVYDKDDISYLGCSGFEISASKVSK